MGTGRPPGRPRKNPLPPMSPKVKELLEALGESGGETLFWRFRERTVGGLRFLGEMVPVSTVPADEVGDYVEKLRSEYGAEGDIVAYIHAAGSADAMKKPDGSPAKVVFLAPERLAATNFRAKGGVLPPGLAERAKEQADLEAELAIDRKDVKLAEEKKRIEAMKNGNGAPNGADPHWPFGPGVPYEVVEVEPGVFQAFLKEPGGRRRPEFD